MPASSVTAGKNDLADKVRPSIKRPGETEEEPPETEGSDLADGVVDAAVEPEASQSDGEPISESAA